MFLTIISNVVGAQIILSEPHGSGMFRFAEIIADFGGLIEAIAHQTLFAVVSAQLHASTALSWVLMWVKHDLRVHVAVQGGGADFGAAGQLGAVARSERRALRLPQPVALLIGRERAETARRDER